MSWKHSLNQYDVAITIALIVQCIAFIHNAALLIYRIFSTYAYVSSTNNNACSDKTTNRIHHLTLFTMLLLSIQRIPQILTATDMVPPSVSCEHWFFIQAISFFCTKTAVHILFIERLYAIFYKSAFRFRVST
eukprot:176663_1